MLDSGYIYVYEGAEKRIKSLSSVKKEYNIKNCEIHNSIVGVDIDVVGSDKGEIIPPSELPSCDILELDCEGAEKNIVENLQIRPKFIFVEVHPHKKRYSPLVLDSLKNMGYHFIRYVGHEGVELNEDTFHHMLNYDTGTVFEIRDRIEREFKRNNYIRIPKFPPVVCARYSK